VLQQVLLVFHVLLSASIIGLVLLQRGKGADAGAGFGAGASGTVFGARGSATFFSKTTAILATLFFVTSLWLAYLASHRTEVSKSLLDRVPPASAPAVPGPSAPTPAPAAPAPSDVPAVPGARGATAAPSGPAPAAPGK
jgi:preprotein translocase subunit SecG